MSTNVNISVNGGGSGEGNLLERNRQQVGANRQAKLETDNTNNIEATGKEQRTRRRLATGAGTNGNAADDNNPYGTPFIPVLPEKELAASTRGYGALLTGPFTYLDFGGSDSGLLVKCKGNKNVFASRYSYEDERAYSEGVSVAGPAANTFALEPAPVPNQPEPVYYYGQRQDNGEFLGWFYYDQASVELPRLTCLYAVQRQPYNTVLQWQIGAYETPAPPYEVLTLENTLQAVAGFKSLRKINVFTHEFIMRMPQSKFDDGDSTAYVLAADAPGRIAGVNCSMGGISIGISVRENWDYGIDQFLIRLSQPVVATQIVYVSQKLDDFKCTCGVFAPTFKTAQGASLDGIAAGTFPLTEISPGDFVHCALTRYIDNGVPRWSVFLNGTPLLVGVQEPANWTETYGTQPPSVVLNAFSNRNAYASNVLPLPALHAARFTPKVLYRESFTPPTAITRLI